MLIQVVCQAYTYMWAYTCTAKTDIFTDGAETGASLVEMRSGASVAKGYAWLKYYCGTYEL